MKKSLRFLSGMKTKRIRDKKEASTLAWASQVLTEQANENGDEHELWKWLSLLLDRRLKGEKSP